MTDVIGAAALAAKELEYQQRRAELYAIKMDRYRAAEMAMAAGDITYGEYVDELKLAFRAYTDQAYTLAQAS